MGSISRTEFSERVYSTNVNAQIFGTGLWNVPSHYNRIRRLLLVGLLLRKVNSLTLTLFFFSMGKASWISTDDVTMWNEKTYG